MKATEQTLSGWGQFPVETCYVSNAETVDSLRAIVAGHEQVDYIARGLGRAYGDSSLNRGRGVLVQTQRHHFLDFDEQAGILSCEAGVSFAEIIEFFLPRGWFLPTTPGTKFVTVGGAIAADVHGKNHHCDGSFGSFVLEFDLLTAAGDVLKCSRSENTEVFWATIGGMGLTGVILSARFQLSKAETAYYDVTFRRTANLAATLACFRETDQQYRYSVAWIDGISSGDALGRSVVMLGNDARRADLPAKLAAHPLRAPAHRQKSVPLNFPSFALSPLSVRAFNSLYYAKHKDSRKFIDFDTYLYPLDGIRHWYRIYGRRGFIQYQALFPPETADSGLHEMMSTIAESRQASFLAVLKSSGPANAGLLSYLYPGFTLALDFPYCGHRTDQLVRRLDEILLAHRGRLYLAKDATTTPAAFAAMYPRLDEFRRVKAQIDPTNRFVSSQARRLGIVETP